MKKSFLVFLILIFTFMGCSSTGSNDNTMTNVILEEPTNEYILHTAK